MGIDERAADLIAGAVGGGGTLVLAGGSTPRGAYELLATRADIDWERVDVYFGDERCVPPDDPGSNFRMAFEALLRHVPARVHRIPGELGALRAAEWYESEVRAVPRFDLVLLGIGTDGHTASLFPGGPELHSDRLVVATRSPQPPHERVSLTLRAINASRRVAFLVKGKEEIVARVQAGDATLPAARVKDPVWLIGH